MPLLLSSLRLVTKGPEIIFGKTGPLYWLALISGILVHPIFLIMRETIYAHASKTYVVSESILTTTKYHVSQFIQADLGLETHFQVTMAAILVLLVNSETRTIVGLEKLFKEDTIFFLPTQVALALSISWSLYSCITSHLKGISKKRDHSTTKSYATLLGFTSISIFVRVWSYILFWTPCLGLLNLLRHLQGEMYPFKLPYHSKVNVSQDLFYFGNATQIPWTDVTRWNYTGFKEAESPQLELYTYYTIEQYFVIFMLIVCANITLQIVAKRITNPEVFKRTSWIDLFIHGLSCCLIPHPLEEWDEANGTFAMHKMRQKIVWKEMFASILLNLGFNIAFLSPLIILGK